MRPLVPLLLLLAGCMQPENPFISDDGGTGGGAAGSGGGSAGAGGGNSGTGGGGGGSSCTEDWQCTSWQLADAGTAMRSCVDANACGTTALKPLEGPTAAPSLDRNYYRCNVQVVFDKTCAMMGCHGVDQGRDFRVYSRGRWRHKEMVPAAPTCLVTGLRDLQVEGSGTVMCLGWSRLTATEWQLNYDSARLFGTGLTDQAQNALLTEPLKGSSFAHANAKVWAAGDPMYATVKAWLEGATAPSTCDGGFN